MPDTNEPRRVDAELEILSARIDNARQQARMLRNELNDISAEARRIVGVLEGMRLR